MSYSAFIPALFITSISVADLAAVPAIPWVVSAAVPLIAVAALASTIVVPLVNLVCVSTLSTY